MISVSGSISSVDLCVWLNILNILSSVTAVRVDARNLVQIPLGPQKPLPAPSPVVIIRSADRGFGRDGLDPLLAVTMPKNRDTLESTWFSCSLSLIWIVGFVPDPSSPDWAAEFKALISSKFILANVQSRWQPCCSEQPRWWLKMMVRSRAASLKNCPKDWFVLELSSARAEKKWTSSTSIPQTDSVLTGVLGPEYD